MKKVYMLLCVTLNDNEEQIAEPIPIAGSSSEEVTREVVEVFRKRKNGRTTMTHDEAIKILLPGLIPESKIEALLEKKEESSEDSTNRIFDLIEE